MRSELFQIYNSIANVSSSTFTDKLANVFRAKEFVQIRVSAETKPRDRKFFAGSFLVFMVSTSRDLIVLQRIVLTSLLAGRKDFLGRWDEFAIAVARGDDARSILDRRGNLRVPKDRRRNTELKGCIPIYINSSTLVRRLFESRESFLLSIFSHDFIIFY